MDAAAALVRRNALPSVAPSLLLEPTQAFLASDRLGKESARSLLEHTQAEAFLRGMGHVHRHLLLHQQFSVIAAFSGTNFEIEFHEGSLQG